MKEVKFQRKITKTLQFKNWVNILNQHIQYRLQEGQKNPKVKNYLIARAGIFSSIFVSYTGFLEKKIDSLGRRNSFWSELWQYISLAQLLIDYVAVTQLIL